MKLNHQRLKRKMIDSPVLWTSKGKKCPESIIKSKTELSLGDSC